MFISEHKKGAEERIPGSSAQSESRPCLTPSRKTSQMISRQERRRFVINAFVSCEMSFRCHPITQNERHEEPKPSYFSRCLLIWLDRQLSLHSSDPAVPMRRPSVTRRDSQFGERHLMKSERESRESGLPCPSVGNVTIFHLTEYSDRRSSRSEAAQ